ncbi:GAF domain-containing protein [Nakamurella deserti]|uniref:GAF domain-containing protein n=1 Tax=Nakamurella deserti TaxID=2164074 RepID=UPI000DBE2D80|nr:GAF domain-containing protein [Nakamurella deserti]
MDVTSRFAVALSGARDRAGNSGAGEPERASSACAEVLRAAGASVCVISPDGFHLPVSISDRFAGLGESLQFTTGDGPCVDAHATGDVVCATRSVLAARWPLFHARLTALTPYRAVVAVPMRAGGTRLGSVDLYFRTDDELVGLDLDEGRVVVALVAGLLTAADPDTPPRWMDTAHLTSRNGVMVAVGMMAVHLGVDAHDALALLRAYALAVDVTVDDAARRVMDRTVDTATLIRPRH